MIGITTSAFRDVLARGSLREAEPGLGLGRELTFRDGPEREIVVHFGAADSAQYVRDVTDTILALEDSWLLLPRHGALGSLGILDGDDNAAAIRFQAPELSTLADYLCTRPMSLSEVSADLYAVADPGTILLTWDHHGRRRPEHPVSSGSRRDPASRRPQRARRRARTVLPSECDRQPLISTRLYLAGADGPLLVRLHL